MKEEIIPTRKMIVPTSEGFLVIEQKGAENEYAGVFIYYQDHKGEINVKSDNLVACVEDDFGEICTETYCKKYDEPINIIQYSDGHDRND